MATRGESIQFPIPTRGITVHEHPLLVGPAGLTDARNWLYRGGRLQTRFGVTNFQGEQVPQVDGGYTYAQNVQERPLGFLQYDYVSSALIDRDRLVMGTDEGIWVYDTTESKWRDQCFAYDSGAVAAAGNTSTGAPVQSGSAAASVYVTIVIETGGLKADAKYDWYLSGVKQNTIAIDCTSNLVTNGLTFTFSNGVSNYVAGDSWTTDAGPAMTLTGGVADQVVMRAWDYQGVTYVIGANGKDPIWYWTGTITDPARPVTKTVPPTAKSIALCGGRVLAGNCTFNSTYYPNTIFYSDLFDHNTWSDANPIRLADTPGDIISMLEMGELTTIVYKSDSINVIAAQGGTFPFGTDMLASGIAGLASPKSVIAISESTHVYMSSDGEMFFFDGAAPRSMGDSIREYVQAAMDLNYSERSWIIYDDYHNEVWVFYPGVGAGGKISRAICVPIREGIPLWPQSWARDVIKFDWSAGIFAFYASSPTYGDFDPSYLGMTDYSDVDVAYSALSIVSSGLLLGNGTTAGLVNKGQVYRSNYGGTDDGRNIDATLTTGMSQAGGLDRYVIVKEVHHEMDVGSGSGGVAISCSVTGAENADAASLTPSASYADSQVLDVSSSAPPYRTEHRLRARFFGLKIAVSTAGPTAYYAGSIAQIRTGGKR